MCLNRLFPYNIYMKPLNHPLEQIQRLPDLSGRFSIEIDPEQKIARFERLQNVPHCAHGVSHDGGNMAFSQEETQKRKEKVAKRLTKFLERIGIENAINPITLADEGNCAVAELEDLTEKNSDAIKKNERGTFVSASALFTTTPDTPLVLKVADCYGGLIYAKTPAGKTVVGLIHAGRLELGARIVETSVQFLKKMYDVDPQNIIACFTPALAQEHHVIRKDDIERVLGTAQEYWRKHSTIDEETGDWNINMKSALKEQLKHARILASNISIDPRDTFQEAETFPSQRRTTQLGKPHEKAGRYALAIAFT
ncbi:MAG: hypothetical protein UW24_C0005G0015 [Parcubacteria group bacterium GW2011_GWA2_44_12]|nr:MAG: hypothetical protein UW24_C0005G0015 [Parcubacteria group bacterium GW2011_GWA2_44_12]